MKEYIVLLNMYAGDGWIDGAEIELDRFYYRISATTYVNRMSDDDIAEYLEHCDGFKVSVLDDRGNELSECWVDEDGNIVH